MSSISSSEVERADILRQEGNELYKSGKIRKAIKKYQESANLVPESYAPLGNLSAAYFEMGEYTQCITRAERALELLKESKAGEDNALVEKFQQRINRARANSYKSSGLEQLQTRLRILDSLPRYRPSFLTSEEYYTIGHDEPTSLFDLTIDKHEPMGSSVSFLFGGIGDARHLIRTIIGIAELEKKYQLKQKQYHLTMIDVNKYALTRDLIMFMLLEELSGLEANSEKAEEVLTTLFFVFIAVIIPRIAFDHLHHTIDRALSELQSGVQPLDWMYINKEDFHVYIQSLKSWKGRALTIITTAAAIDEVTMQLHRNAMELPLPPIPGGNQVPTACKKENKLYKSTAILIPPKRVLQNHDPQMLVLLQDHITKPKTNAAKFKKHLQQYWNLNTTLVDVEWFDSLTDKHDYDVGTDPFSALESLAPGFETLPTKTKNPTRLYDYFAPFFIDAAQSIKYLKGRLQVEAIHGDYVDIAEKLRFKLYRDEDSSDSQEVTASKIIRRKEFPILYDRVHLSNVPDYMGGHLSTFLYASPLLKPLPSSSVESNCLRNSGTWNNLESFLAEYQLITDTKMLQQLTSVTVLSRGMFPWPMADYTHYGVSESLHRSFGDLLPRKPFMKWFFALFLRLAIPYNLDLRQFQSVIYSPLNLSILFRLVVHLRAIGYPSHWLSEALSNILESKVRTTARPPRKSPNSVAEVKREHPEKHVCTAPFAQEMGTLAKIFEPLLPFSLPSLSVIPQSNGISHYRFNMTNVLRVQDDSVASTHLALVFWDHDRLLQCGEGIENTFFANMRSILDSSWGDKYWSEYMGSQVEIFRENGVVIWTTIGYDVVTGVVSVWMPEVFIEKVKKSWACGLWRVDTWQTVNSGPVMAKDTVVKGERWIDVK
ncbi:hypothetical protein NHQ30_005319 [Ciborinia camelliae]|nr:hypothetical protein NHQ30_005319 [Ciborinia camelliae]